MRKQRSVLPLAKDRGKGTPALRLERFCFRALLLLLLWSAAYQGGMATAKAQVVEYPFHNAIRLQDFAEARRLLDKGGPSLLTETDSFGMLPLHSAASLGSVEALVFLIDEGADMRTPQQGYSQLVRGRSPLHLAVATGKVQLIDLLVEAGADVFARDNGGVTPLHLAVQYGRIRAATRLIEISGEQSHVRDKNGTTPLHLAARHGRDIIITKLLFLGNKEKTTLRGQLQKLLGDESGLAKDFARRWRAGLVNAQNNFGLSSLHYASLGGHEEVVELLLEQGAEINITNNQGLTPLFMAARAGSTEVVDILSKRSGINLESGDLEAHTPLSIAVANGHLRIFARLLRSGANPHAKNKNGMIPLHIAAQRGNLEAVVALLKTLKDKDKEGYINERDKSGNTPLHYGAMAGKKDLVTKLLQAGADSRLSNKKGETAQDIAGELGDDEILSVLR